MCQLVEIQNDAKFEIRQIMSYCHDCRSRFRYDSGSKVFREIPVLNHKLDNIVDAVCLFQQSVPKRMQKDPNGH